jgi:t-SNARE complex subunit (syntaxin)
LASTFGLGSDLKKAKKLAFALRSRFDIETVIIIIIIIIIIQIVAPVLCDPPNLKMRGPAALPKKL